MISVCCETYLILIKCLLWILLTAQEVVSLLLPQQAGHILNQSFHALTCQFSLLQSLNQAQTLQFQFIAMLQVVYIDYFRCCLKKFTSLSQLQKAFTMSLTQRFRLLDLLNQLNKSRILDAQQSSLQH